jgi:outer membrane scaffolding protein for murein synthesis (MipA/OmpV family)
LNYNAAKEARWSLQLGGGVGYTRHYTKFNFDLDMVPQLEEEYLGGYDRLTAGTQIFEQIRFQYLNNSLVSLSAGFEFLQGFTKHQRAYDFTTRSPQNQGYFDLGFGAFIGVIIPIKLGQTSASEEYYID